jgi:hypothetical protein
VHDAGSVRDPPRRERAEERGRRLAAELLCGTTCREATSGVRHDDETLPVANDDEIFDGGKDVFQQLLAPLDWKRSSRSAAFRSPS